MKRIVIELSDKTFDNWLRYNLNNQDDQIDLSYLVEQTLVAFFEKNIKRRSKVAVQRKP